MQYLPTLGKNIDQPLPQDDTMMQLEMQRRMKFADALRNQAAPEGQMVSGHYVAPSWTQNLANLANKYVAGQQEQNAMKQYGEAQTSKAQKLGELMKGKTTFETDAEGNQREVTKPYSKEELIAQLSGIDSSYAPKLFDTYLSNIYKEEAPQKLGANEALVTKVNGKYTPLYTNTVDKPEAMSPLARLQGERAKLIQANPQDPRIKEIDNAITKETSFAPPPKMEVNLPKVEQSARIAANEDFSKNVYRPTMDAAARNTTVLSRLDALDKLPISEQTGWGIQAQAAAKNVLVGLGYKDEEAKQLASNAQTFKAIQSRQINDELNAAKGPQTEGDAQRAAQTVANLGNTPQANQFINSLQRAIIRRKNEEAKFYRANYNKALQANDLSQLERDWMDSPEATKSIFDYPEMKAWSTVKGGANASAGQDYHSKYGLTPAPQTQGR